MLQVVEVMQDDFLRRLGRFLISSHLLYEWPEAVRLALSGMIVVRAEQRYDYDGIEYIALSENFRPLAEGSRAVDYQPIIEKVMNEDGEMVGCYVKEWCEVKD